MTHIYLGDRVLYVSKPRDAVVEELTRGLREQRMVQFITDDDDLIVVNPYRVDFVRRHDDKRPLHSTTTTR